MSEQPGRYQRSASGMVGAMLVLLLIIGVYVGFRALNREDLEVEPERVDYLAAARFAQESDRTVVYPPTVPEDWKPTSVESRTGDEWGIGFVTPHGFAGLHQSEGSTDDLLATYVGEDAAEVGPVQIDGSDLPWQAYEDSGGDVGFLGDVDGEQVLVYGSAPPADLQRLAGSLTTEPVP
ncbi:MAG: DUF4245 domain-containing protein [Nocardioides sp.]